MRSNGKVLYTRFTHNLILDIYQRYITSLSLFSNISCNEFVFFFNIVERGILLAQSVSGLTDGFTCRVYGDGTAEGVGREGSRDFDAGDAV